MENQKLIKLYKYMPVTDYSIDSILSSNFAFSKASRFNDPFELIVPVTTVIEKHNFTLDDRGKANLKRIVETRDFDYQELFYICCFSRQFDVDLMWSHYAEFHKGICFEFSIPESEYSNMAFEDVIYTDESVYIQLNTRLTTNPKEGNSQLEDTPEENELWRSLIKRKKASWSYEEEVRCIIDAKGNEEPLQILKVDYITKVFTGAKISMEDLRKVKEAALISGVEVVQMELDIANKEVKPKVY